MRLRILHFYNNQNELQARYVGMLTEYMGGSVELYAYHSLPEVKETLNNIHFDILHIHGCWSVHYAKAAMLALRNGTRVIISPHGELEPWILRNRQWQEKMPKTLLYQRQTIQDAYVVIAMGSMEEKSLRTLAWNPRIETVRNALITKSISPQEMSQQLLRIYQKVMDSDVFHLMDESTKCTLFLFIKAAVSGHPGWLEGMDIPPLDNNAWRQLLIYAKQEQIEHLLKRGIHVMGMKEPYIDISQVESYFPQGYAPLKSISASIGNKFISENDRLLATFKYLHRLMTTRRLAIAHMMELEREIREHDIDETLLTETLEEHHLLLFARRLMGVLADFTHFEEGMMPVSPVHDKQKERIKEIITNHLKI